MLYINLLLTLTLTLTLSHPVLLLCRVKALMPDAAYYTNIAWSVCLYQKQAHKLVLWLQQTVRVIDCVLYSTEAEILSFYLAC